MPSKCKVRNCFPLLVGQHILVPALLRDASGQALYKVAFAYHSGKSVHVRAPRAFRRTASQ